MNDIIKLGLQAKLRDLGITWARVRDFQLDKAERRAIATVELDGEIEVVEVRALYKVDANHVVVVEASASRAWIAGALQLALERHGGRFPLPGGMAGTAARFALGG
ncbi:MAG: hypothetical protein R3F11_17160 [Verrucomicrobiales bacterium]